MTDFRIPGRRLGFVGVAVLVALIPMTAVPPATAQPTTSADLAVTMQWVGNGTPRARVGELATFAIIVTNRGPDTAVATVLSIATPDPLNPISLTCSDPAACGSGVDLAPGATMTATLVEQVCCFPEGESRETQVSALVNSQPPEATPDPDASNNIATVVLRIVGPHGFAF